MLFHVRMDVRLPHDLNADARADIVAREKAYAQDLQRAGKWPQLWRVVGEYANISIFDVDSSCLNSLKASWAPAPQVVNATRASARPMRAKGEMPNICFVNRLTSEIAKATSRPTRWQIQDPPFAAA